MRSAGQNVVIVMFALNSIGFLAGLISLAGNYLAKVIARKFQPCSRLARRARLRYMLLVPKEVSPHQNITDEHRFIDSLSIAGKVQLELFLILPVANFCAAASTLAIEPTPVSSTENLFAIFAIVEVLIYLIFSPLLMHVRYLLSPVECLGEAARYFSISAQRYRREQSYWKKLAYATNLRRFLYVASKCGVDPHNRFVGNLRRTADNPQRSPAAVYRNIADVFHISRGVVSGEYVWTRATNTWSRQGKLSTTLLKLLTMVPGIALVWQVILGILTLLK